MNLLVVGNEARTAEFQEKFGASNDLDILTESHDPAEIVENAAKADAIFDLNFDDHPAIIQSYAGLKQKVIFACAVKWSLNDAVGLAEDKLECTLVGMNALPTFINRSEMEISLFNENDLKAVHKITEQLPHSIKLVKDRVGMITPRIIFMIINEACYTVQEGTANMDDIDQAMKLGTNYPFGPFEWADKIGVKDIYETLTAIYDDTKDERYKICSLLKSKYLRNESFR